MNDDRIKGAARKVTRKVPKKIEAVAANDRLEAVSVVEHAFGTVQDSYGRAREAVRDLLDKAPSTRTVLDTGRDYYRRGSAAVARTAGDNTALTLLAAGIAVAAVSWLVLGPKGGKADE